MKLILPLVVLAGLAPQEGKAKGGISVWDPGKVSVAPLNVEARDEWIALGDAAPFKGDAVVSNGRITAVFRRESGAVASQFHDPPSIEPYSSELVAAERGIVLGKKSGLDSIRIKAEELGLELPEERRPAVLAAVKALGTGKRGLVTDDEFRSIVGDSAR